MDFILYSFLRHKKKYPWKYVTESKVKSWKLHRARLIVLHFVCVSSPSSALLLCFVHSRSSRLSYCSGSCLLRYMKLQTETSYMWVTNFLGSLIFYHFCLSNFIRSNLPSLPKERALTLESFWWRRQKCGNRARKAGNTSFGIFLFVFCAYLQHALTTPRPWIRYTQEDYKK